MKPAKHKPTWIDISEDVVNSMVSKAELEQARPILSVLSIRVADAILRGWADNISGALKVLGKPLTLESAVRQELADYFQPK